MTPEQKKWIDEASYEQLLRRWRFSDVGDEMFIGEAGEYFSMVFAQKRMNDPTKAVAASKTVGWLNIKQ